ncbi:hypothetical protein DLM_1886 [Aquitalea magnusonii]|uniref:Uncharacterized protein n=1 Tax=Aquitalea magnusonii TaxID=332411 RepID=A0A3G9GHC9_9NEIS|nr:hypothetical protein [Aquitalea magnusonii]BBF85502.1 hypothetical protein DLM_1886 [Aquitalea magnusonii]
MTQNYSENWQHLKSILTGFSTNNREPKLHWHSDHIHAKALSIFLAHATLATPRLDRMTVREVLAGHQEWPHTPDARQFEGVSLPLSLLEELGLVGFYADWCTVHSRSPNQDDVDPILIPLIQAIEHLKDICWGRNGYIQPHYVCPVDELQKLLADHFGSTPVAELIPELSLEDIYFKLHPGNINFDSLVSTYLWQRLRAILEPSEAFERWMLCLRVNCEWAFPVLFGDSDYEQKAEFNNQLLAYVAQDSGLFTTSETLKRQAINKDRFSHIAIPVSTHLKYTIDADGNSPSECQDVIGFEKPTLDTLRAAYPLPSSDNTTDLQLVRNWHYSGHWLEPQLLYTWLLSFSIEDSIRIESHLLASYGFVEKLLELAASRPLLKHLLFNVLPDYESATYKLFLLSQSATCDVALFYLTQKSFSSRRDSKSFMRNFDKSYQNLVCHEYLRAIEVEPDSGDRLLKVVDLLGGRCGFHTRDFPESHEYQFLLCFLDSLSHQRVVQLGKAFSEWCATTKIKHAHQCSQLHWYFLGFWLIERIEQLGIDLAGTLICNLRENLLGYYRAEIVESLAGKQHSLEPNDFFSALPWHKLVGSEGPVQLLEISNRCGDWQAKLSYSNVNNFSVASAVRHYLQVLMCVGRPHRIPQDWKRFASRVVEIVRMLGFGPREEATYLFDTAFYLEKYDLWSQFCSYTNLLERELYDEIVDRCLPYVPLNQLFILLERCNVIARTRELQEIIATRQSPDSENLGLSSLEQAFISAWDAGNYDQASRLIGTAISIFDQDRFSNTKNPHFLRVRKKWQIYEYKWHLLKLLETFKGHPEEYAREARKVSMPHENIGGPTRNDEDVYNRECEQFRRYIIAAAYCETSPEKCIDIMEQLCKENKSNNFSFMLFKGRVALHEINDDTTGLRHALSQLLNSLIDLTPENMPPLWIAHILDAYRQLHDQEIDNFWGKLNPDQQARREILRPYCRALMERGDTLIAQHILTRYQDLNFQASDELGIDDLADEVVKTNEKSMLQLIQVVNEASERSIVQLKKHYSQIVSKEFEDYVTIVGQELEPHEFLKNVVVEVAQELLLRKKNLQIHSEYLEDRISFRISKEDLINDWFTSLFDKRMAEARIGFRDQKRGGKSTSGESPGEIDAFITDAKNRRISIFEAFRLFSKDAKVISDHLNKIAGYDNESLSPVFIVAYCDVNDFDALVSGYSAFIASQNYTGFTIDSLTDGSIRTLDFKGHLWIGMERRWRGHREIIFYHLLLNMGSQ